MSYRHLFKANCSRCLLRIYLKGLFVGGGVFLLLIVLTPTVADAAAGWTDYGAISELNQQPVAGGPGAHAGVTS